MPTLEEIKAKQQVTWNSGDYGKIAWITVPLADVLCDAIDIRPGSKVLDVACGTGHVALAAARRFCKVTGSDYVPKFLEVARARAAAEGLTVDFREGDAENLPFDSGSFDYVLSNIGAMFAPNQEKTASELLRVCAPGGTVGMINWKPQGFVGELFTVAGRFIPPPAGLKPASLWGTEDRLRELFGDGAASLTFKNGSIPQRYLSVEHYADFFLQNYGPSLKTAEALDGEKRKEYRQALVALAGKFNRANDGTCVYDSDYTIVIATRKK